MMTDREELLKLISAAKWEADRKCLLLDCRERAPEDADCNKCEAKMIAEHLIDHGVMVVVEAAWLIDGAWAECSHCHESEKVEALTHRDYCPACGARMVIK